MKFLPALLFVFVLASGCGWVHHPGLAATPPGEGNLVGGDPYRPPLQGRGIQHKGSIGLRDYRQAVSDMGVAQDQTQRAHIPEDRAPAARSYDRVQLHRPSEGHPQSRNTGGVASHPGYAADREGAPGRLAGR